MSPDRLRSVTLLDHPDVKRISDEVAKWRKNQDDLRALVKRDPQQFTNEWVAFAEGKVFVRRPLGSTPEEALENLRSLYRDADEKSDKLGINRGTIAFMQVY